MARHKHWPPEHPGYEKAPWCDLSTKKACDERYTTWLHGHLGTPCVKIVKPGNVLATCSIQRVDDEEAARVSRERQAREQAALDFEQKERRRVQEILHPAS